MSPTTYHFAHTCTVDAPPAQVQAVLVDLERYPSWWPQVKAVARLGPETGLVVCRSVLPYDLELVLERVSESADELEVAISGPLDGFARWTMSPAGSGTRLDYRQEVRTRGLLMALASYAVKPVLRWNHAVMMRGCEAGLAKLFRDIPSADREDRMPAPPS